MRQEDFLKLYVDYKNEPDASGEKPEEYVPTDIDRSAALLAWKYAEAELRTSVVMAGLAARKNRKTKPALVVTTTPPSVA